MHKDAIRCTEMILDERQIDRETKREKDGKSKRQYDEKTEKQDGKNKDK